MATTMKRYITDRAEVVPSSGCWEWTASVGSHGYGNAYANGRVQVAHRVSYEAFQGHIPLGAFVLHSCNVKTCVNPEHLYLGDHVQNMDDVSFGRYHPKRKLGATEVTNVRCSTATQRELAEKYGVSQRSIWNALHLKTYRHG